MEHGEGPRVVKVLDVRPRNTGGGYNFFLHDGMYSTWQIGASIKGEDLAVLTQSKSIIKIKKALIMKGYQIWIEDFDIVKKEVNNMICSFDE